MRKTILAAILLLGLTTQSRGEDYCKEREYAELKDMDKAELIETFKTYADKVNFLFAELDRLDTGNTANYSISKLDDTIAKQRLYISQSTKCTERLGEFTRQLKKRYKFNEKQISALYKSYVKIPKIKNHEGTPK